MSARRVFPLALFPALELVLLTLALARVDSGPAAWAPFAVLAAVALSFSVHVTFHELVHAPGAAEHPLAVPVSAAATLLAGLPLDGYRWHHYNHHRHENGPEDFSTTWDWTGEKARPRGWLAYSLGWPGQLRRSRDDMRVADEEGRLPPWIKSRARWEQRLLTVVWVAAFVASWRAAAVYAAVVYLGWTLVALHNHGQHPPVRPDARVITSFAGRAYNALSCNNGLHFEHHAEPQRSWLDLAPDAGSTPIVVPHLLQPLLGAADRR